jgi:hypothetical protein
MRLLTFFMILSNLEAFITACNAFGKVDLGGAMNAVAVVQILLNLMIVVVFCMWFCNTNLHKRLVQGMWANLVQTVLATCVAYQFAAVWAADAISAAETVIADAEADEYAK